MKLASFFILSLGLHASALVYPFSFHAAHQTSLIQVAILPMEQESHGTGARGTSGKAAAGRKPAGPVVGTVQPQREWKAYGDREPQSSPAATITTFSENSAALASPMANSALAQEAISAGASQDAQGVGAGGIGGRGSGTGAGGNGPGSGSQGAGSGGGLIQARYSETPKPIYPESARREGREGKVLLRVLVDDRGRSKTVEINTSSGSEALDHAAAEAIKRWRFHPARDGDKAVESWLRIPIEFRLADAQTR